MNGTLGKPYKFFYSARNFVSGLTDIIALVKKPDGSTHGTFPLTELSGSLFFGTYFFDLTTIQADLSGEYTIVIYEQTAIFREISKVSMSLPSGDDLDVSIEAELFGKISSDIIIGKIEASTNLIGVIENIELSGKIIDNEIIKGVLDSNILFATISEDTILGKLSECTIWLL